ncbi:hypothetical protein J6590_105743 [Homalodisca vitripennis]|nr:hypothetical protein J6590_105743 [Homalodisca vitripennis]
MADSSREIPRLDTILRRSALLVPGSMADSSGEIPRLDTILRRSALLIPGSMADSSREIPRLDTIHRRSALLVPGSMADSSREIPRLDTIHRRSALLVPGSMADSSREIPRLDTIHRRSALLVPGSMADSSDEIVCVWILQLRSSYTTHHFQPPRKPIASVLKEVFPKKFTEEEAASSVLRGSDRGYAVCITSMEYEFKSQSLLINTRHYPSSVAKLQKFSSVAERRVIPPLFHTQIQIQKLQQQQIRK